MYFLAGTVTALSQNCQTYWCCCCDPHIWSIVKIFRQFATAGAVTAPFAQPTCQSCSSCVANELHFAPNGVLTQVDCFCPSGDIVGGRTDQPVAAALTLLHPASVFQLKNINLRQWQQIASSMMWATNNQPALASAIATLPELQWPHHQWYQHCTSLQVQLPFLRFLRTVADGTTTSWHWTLQIKNINLLSSVSASPLHWVYAVIYI